MTPPKSPKSQLHRPPRNRTGVLGRGGVSRLVRSMTRSAIDTPANDYSDGPIEAPTWRRTPKTSAVPHQSLTSPSVNFRI